MYTPQRAIERIIDNCNLEHGGVHKVYGWDKYFAVYRLDHNKITFDVKSKNPRQATLRKLLIKELKKRVESIKYDLDFTHYNECSGFKIVDPYSVRALVEKYLVGQYMDLPYRDSKKAA